MSVIRLGKPAVAVKITEQGTYLAKLEHVWQAARRYAKKRGFKVVESYGVVDAPRFEVTRRMRGSCIFASRSKSR